MKKVFKKFIFNHATVLDLACGTGAIEEALKDQKVKIIGLDISAGMLTIAKKRFDNYKNMAFRKASFMNAKIAQIFDVITISHATRFVPKDEEKKFIRNIDHWLNDDGYFIVFVHDDPFTKIYHTFMPKLGIHWKYNINFQYKKLLVKELEETFTLIRVIPSIEKYLFNKEIALIFKKA
jgi:demethylmenaquinone methyltransferase/2-methoxy-6-polyprenyl-1,4-benzoquinol methylase